ncbi:MAG: DNA/RNA non-specific endonuclease [Bacteroidales bacterium]|nr:DNA/RNA non-specific endonuclease [Bacteroidales bacterium]
MAVAFSALATAVSCELLQPNTDDELTVKENSLSVVDNPVSFAEGSQYLLVTAADEWTLSLDFGEVEEEWVNVSDEAGRPGSRKLIMAWARNEEEESRTCRLTLTVGSDIKTLDFVQRGHSSVGPVTPVEGLNPDPVPHWLELPATDNPDLYFFTHDMQHGGKTKRNYSFYLDPAALVAVWVAYPLNDNLAGSGSRSDAWGLDPKVPRQYQAVLFSGFRGYDRGHQLPSADRYGAGINETTFYGTNMTPQLGTLNQKAWAALEGKVRTWASSFDTLYVVTGCDIRGYTKTAKDNDGKEVAVPVGYFKALLGFKRAGTAGNTAKQGGYTAIGFYFNHEYYANSEIMNQSMTIEELEAMLDIDFFPNLEAMVGTELYTKIESTIDDSPNKVWK